MTAASVPALELGFDFHRVFAAGVGEQRLPGRHGLVFAPRAALADEALAIIDLASERLIERAAVRLVDTPLWERQALGMAVYRGPVRREQESAALHRLRAEAVEEQLRVVRAAVRRCEHFLSSRRTGSERLSAHPAVAQSLARVVSDVAALSSGDIGASLRTPAGRGWLTSEIDAVARRLIKLSGGRALLAGQAVQLRTLLLTFNRLYLEG